LNCGCPKVGGNFKNYYSYKVDWYKVAYTTTKTEIKAGEWTKYETCGDDEKCAGYRGV
jgi:hypothetical protein